MNERDVVRLERVQDNGWTVGMILVPLSDGGLLVYSPTWLGPDTAERVRAYGEPRILVAPNAYHHLSLSRFRDLFPGALAVAGAGARARLARKGHADVADISAASVDDGIRLVEVPHTKNGEVWVTVANESGSTWVVADAFFNASPPLTGLAGAFLRATKTGPGLCIGQTFRWLGLADERAYRRWLLAELETPPRALHVCHGETLVADDLGERLRTLVTDRLRA